jgi:hypothetical protein
MIVDQTARDMAMSAINLVNTHESVCEERAKAAKLWREEVTAKLDAISINVDGVYNRLWVMACSVVGLLIVICGYLIAHKGL